jgi:hypothetical protein
MSFSNEQWKAQQKNASRACFITIKNTTAVTLVRTNYHLQSGIWSCFPPGCFHTQKSFFFQRLFLMLLSDRQTNF